MPPDPMDDAYSVARTGEATSWIRLHTRLVARLVRLLRGRFAQRLTPWMIEDVAEEAFEALVLASGRIPDWQKAWAYTHKCAVSLALQSLRASWPRIVTVPLVGDEPQLADPRASSVERRARACEDVAKLRRSVGTVYARLLMACLRCLERNDRLVVSEVAAELGWSIRTARRRLRELRKRCSGIVLDTD